MSHSPLEILTSFIYVTVLLLPYEIENYFG
jgi:hypothetical protein